MNSNQSFQQIDVSNELDVASNHWTATIANPAHCGSCGAAVSENFCSQCGQKRLRQRLSFSQLVSDVLSRVFNWERGWFYTLGCMFRCPGQVARDYVSGKQRCYVSPLAYYFLGAAAQLLVLWCYSPLLRQRFSATFQGTLQAGNNEAASEKLKSVLGQELPDALADVYLATMQQSYSYAALLFFCLPWAIALRFFYQILGDDFRLGETMVFSLYVFGHVLLLTAAIAPFTFTRAAEVHMLLSMSIYFIYPQWAQGSFFGTGIPRRSLTLLSTLISTGIFMGSIVVLFTVSFAIYVGYRTYLFNH